MLGIWLDLPWWVRAIASFLVVGLGVYTTLYSVFWGGIVIVGIGAGMLLAGGKSQSERNGYHF